MWKINTRGRDGWYHLVPSSGFLPPRLTVKNNLQFLSNSNKIVVQLIQYLYNPIYLLHRGPQVLNPMLKTIRQSKVPLSSQNQGWNCAGTDGGPYTFQILINKY